MLKILSISFYSSVILPVLHSTSFVKKVNYEIEKNGFQSAMKRTVNATNTKIVTKGMDEKVWKILQQKPCIIVANRPHHSETVALISQLPDRKNLYVINNADSILLKIFPAINKYIIPVYITHHTRRIYGKRGIVFNKLMGISAKSAVKSHTKNILSMRIAQKKIENGGLLIMYPNGGNKTGKWFDGIGHLLLSIRNPDKVYVVMVHVASVSFYDLFRIIPGISKFLPHVTLHFSDPILIQNLLNSSSPKILKSNLESKYNNWVLSV